MKNSELIKFLKKSGCSFVRHGSNHDIWFSPITYKQFAVPRHKNEIKNGTAKNILKDAGIEEKPSY
jgi:predicted RNA binding protein YcfA (HicA-like mRNA interferase family)